MEVIAEAVSNLHTPFLEESKLESGKNPSDSKEKQETGGGEEDSDGKVSNHGDSSEHKEEEGEGKFEYPLGGPVDDYKMYEKFKDFIVWNPDPDEDYMLDGATEVNWSVWDKYYQEIEESEGFEIETYPGSCPMAHLMPAWRFKEDPEFYRLIQELAELALQQFNEDYTGEFVFLDIERVVESPARGILYYITFKAKDVKEADPIAATKTIQAKVLDGVDERTVEFCRIKKVAA